MGVEQDVNEAMKWLTSAADNGNSLSHYELGRPISLCMARPHMVSALL
jgi:TPR repeat protein